MPWERRCRSARGSGDALPGRSGRPPWRADDDHIENWSAHTRVSTHVDIGHTFDTRRPSPTWWSASRLASRRSMQCSQLGTVPNIPRRYPIDGVSVEPPLPHVLPRKSVNPASRAAGRSSTELGACALVPRGGCASRVRVHEFRIPLLGRNALHPLASNAKRMFDLTTEQMFDSVHVDTNKCSGSGRALRFLSHPDGTFASWA